MICVFGSVAKLQVLSLLNVVHAHTSTVRDYETILSSKVNNDAHLCCLNIHVEYFIQVTIEVQAIDINRARRHFFLLALNRYRNFYKFIFKS